MSRPLKKSRRRRDEMYPLVELYLEGSWTQKEFCEELEMDDPGIGKMQHLFDLMTSAHNPKYMKIKRNQSLMMNNQSKAECLTTTRYQVHIQVILPLSLSKPWIS